MAGRELPASRQRRRFGRGAGQHGMVTVEIAVASLGAAAGLAVMAWLIAVVMILGTCQDLAGAVARQEARGDHAATEQILAHRPSGAHVRIDHRDQQITVSVDVQAQPWTTWLPSVPLHTSATVVQEPA